MIGTEAVDYRWQPIARGHLRRVLLQGFEQLLISLTIEVGLFFTCLDINTFECLLENFIELNLILQIFEELSSLARLDVIERFTDSARFIGQVASIFIKLQYLLYLMVLEYFLEC